jgi:periplasmic divalent cation tolerance protein
VAGTKNIQLVFVMAANLKEASSIGRALVEDRLAACVNVISSVRSIYRWRGAIEESDECLMLIKTTSSSYPRLEKRVKQLHSYEVPEVIAMPLINGSAEYLKWVIDSVTEPATPSSARRRRKPAIHTK